MTLPNFTADASCYRARDVYRPRAAGTPAPDAVTPARDTVFVASGDEIYCCDICGQNQDGTHILCGCGPCASGGSISGTEVLHTLRS
jgi:hypothetical protein